MEKQVKQKGFVVAVMTDAYKERAGCQGSGVHTEVALLNQHQDNQTIRILALSLDKCFSKDRDRWTRGSLSILGSRLVRELENDADIDSIVCHILNKSSIAENKKQ